MALESSVSTTTPLANKDSISFPIGIIGRIPSFSLKTPDYVLLTDRLFTVKKKNTSNL